MRPSSPSSPNPTLGISQAASVVGTSPKSNRSFAPNFGVLIVALFAMATVYLFRVGHARWLPILIAEAVFLSALPWVAYGILHYRYKANPERLSTKASIFGFQLGAILAGILVVLWHLAIRPFGHGAANEIVALSIIQSVGWYLAVFSRVSGFEKTSSILSGALVFFVCCIADDWRIFLFAGLFAFVGLWWLLGQYWNRLESQALDGDSRSLKLHGSAVSLTMLVAVLVTCLAAAIPFSQKRAALVGFMPFSGGEQGSQDEFAISGIGDGSMLTAGSNATTTGAVDSDEFIEDNKPSMYDIMLERYEGPVMKRRRNRAVSLDKIAKHLHEAKVSEQAGRTFRTMRNSDETTDIKLEDRITGALFYVEGSAPARFSINNFRKFDGWDWSSAPEPAETANPPRINLSKRNGDPVFSITRTLANYLTGRRAHRVKIMRLESSVIPAPALLQQWLIKHVDRADMFRWNQAGLIEMDSKAIPGHTMIDIQSLVPNYHLLRDIEIKPHVNFSSDSNPDVSRAPSGFLQVPANESRSAVHTIAKEWTAGIEPGWRQVESIVQHLRKDFDLDPDRERDEQIEDTVHLFLDQRGGPSYMFATTCAMVLRSAGYQTRLASGFLVQKKDYDSQARQSVVTADNLHMWPEVCLDGKFWIPVEPTPGYPIPYSTQTMWQWVTANAVMIGNWLWSHPVTVVLVIATTALAILFRAEWITFLMFGWWFLIRIFWPHRLLKVTRQLIDLRFWFAGDQRPSTETISAWYVRVAANETSKFFSLWNSHNYSEKTARAPRHELVETCRSAINALSLKRIRDFRNDNATNPLSP